MGVPSIGTRTSGSYGVVKTGGVPLVDESTQVVDSEQNQVVDGLIAAETAIGLSSDTADPNGSMEARIKDLEARVTALEAAQP